jgi:hypothetical protein
MLGDMTHVMERLKVDVGTSSIYLWFVNIALKSLNYIIPNIELILSNKSDTVCKETVVA